MDVKIKAYGSVYKVIFCRFKGGRAGNFLGDLDECSGGSGGVLEAVSKEECNILRARSRIREYALCNDWSHFVTLTLSPDKQNRYDIDGYVRNLGAWIGNYNRKYGCKLRYLLIPEQHKDGAWHMHGLFSGLAADSLVRNSFGYLDLPFYSARFGYISLSPIRDKTRCAAYITKYVSKAVGKTDIAVCKHSYYHSQGLAEAEQIGELRATEIPPDVWQNDYCGVAWCNDDEELKRLLDRVR